MNKNLEFKVPRFAHARLKILLSEASYKKAFKLFELGAVQGLEFYGSVAYASVLSAKNKYESSISLKDFFAADCDCYAGQEGRYCKHVVALGLALLDKLGVRDECENIKNLSDFKSLARSAIALIKPYLGPSRVWFQYQMKLELASYIIRSAVQNLPPDKDNAKYLWDFALRLSKKLYEGVVDDSNGFVGDAVYAIIERLADFAAQDEELYDLIKRFDGYTGFGFEDRLKERLANIKL